MWITYIAEIQEAVVQQIRIFYAEAVRMTGQEKLIEKQGCRKEEMVASTVQEFEKKMLEEKKKRSQGDIHTRSYKYDCRC